MWQLQQEKENQTNANYVDQIISKNLKIARNYCKKNGKSLQSLKFSMFSAREKEPGEYRKKIMELVYPSFQKGYL